MNVKIDEYLSPLLARLFSEHGHDADTVPDEGLAAHPDEDIAERAKLEGRMLVTLDRGFGDIRSFPPGSHPGIVVLRPVNQRTATVLALAEELLTRHALGDLIACNVIVQPNAIRIRRPA